MQTTSRHDAQRWFGRGAWPVCESATDFHPAVISFPRYRHRGKLAEKRRDTTPHPSTLPAGMRAEPPVPPRQTRRSQTTTAGCLPNAPFLAGRPLVPTRLRVGRRLHLSAPQARGSRGPGAAQDERRPTDGELAAVAGQSVRVGRAREGRRGLRHGHRQIWDQQVKGRARRRVCMVICGWRWSYLWTAVIFSCVGQQYCLGLIRKNSNR